MLLQFKCPSCGGTRLEEVMANVTVTTEIKSVGEGGDLDYGEDSHEDGEVLRYQCMSCGHILTNSPLVPIIPIRDSEELAEYLSRNAAK